MTIYAKDVLEALQLDPKRPELTICEFGRKYRGIFTITLNFPIVVLTDATLICEALIENGIISVFGRLS